MTMTNYAPTGLIGLAGALSLVGSIFQCYWQELKGKSMPEIELIDVGAEVTKKTQSPVSSQKRCWHIASMAVLGFFYGILIALYILGFVDEGNRPNIYGIAFICLLAGFMVSVISTFLDRIDLIKISGLGKG